MNQNKPTALVTGASGGIGLELARVFAAHGHDLVLVARSAAKLREIADTLQQTHGVAVQVMPKDLTAPGAPKELVEQLQEAGIVVDVLVNNAGFASYGYFYELDLDNELRMIQLNVTALTHLTHLLVHGMVERGSGRILNLASTAAFQPGPLMAVYYATKAYVLSFSEAIANELKDKGVRVTVLCPGPTASGFQSRAAMEESRLVQNGLMDAAAVARAGYEGLMAEKTVVVPGLANQAGTLLPRFAPRTVTTRIVRALQERTGTDEGAHG